MSSATTIVSLKGRRVWDSRGRPTVEAEVALADGSVGRAIAPAGARSGAHAALDLRDGGRAFGGLGVWRALAAIETAIAPALSGMDAAGQEAVDLRLVELDGSERRSRLGANSTIAVSMAVARAAAASARVPLWSHVAHGAGPLLPMPLIQIFGCAAEPGRRMELRDVMVVPVGAGSFDEAIAMTAEIYRVAGEQVAASGSLRGTTDEGGWWPDFGSGEEALDRAVQAIGRAGFRPGGDVALAVDLAASAFGRGGRYRLAGQKAELDATALAERIAAWCSAYPIVSLEDPAAEDDADGMAAIAAALGDRVQLAGDDFLACSAARVREAAASGACNALVVKPGHAGTLSEARAAIDAAREAGWRIVASARSADSEDVSIVHLAVGWRADQLRAGSFARSERMAKWNEAIRIEESLGSRVRFAGWATAGRRVLADA